MSVATLEYLFARGGREHGAVIALQLSGLLYTASYMVIGFVCDFSHTYFTTLAARFGVAYVFGLLVQPRGVAPIQTTNLEL